MITLDPKDLPGRDLYFLLTGTVIPRPIAFVSTVSPEGHGNLAPFSYFNAVASQPPCLAFSAARKGDGEIKDTIKNIQATNEFVIQIVNEEISQKMAQTAADFPYGVDEMKEVGLTPAPSKLVRPPRVDECPVAFECKTYKIIEIGDGGPGSTHHVIGEIVQVHMKDDVYVDGRVQNNAIRAIGRLGGADYIKTQDPFQIPRG